MRGAGGVGASGRSKLARRAAVEQVRLGAEAAREAVRGQADEVAHAVHGELGQRVAHDGRQEQLQGHVAHGLFLGFRGVEDQELAALQGAHDGVGAEAPEADDHASRVRRLRERLPQLPRPGLRRAEQGLEPAGIQPEDARLAGGGLDVRAVVAQAGEQIRDAALDRGRADGAGPQAARQRERRAIAVAGQDARGTGLAVHPQHEPLRLIFVHHGHRLAGPVRVKLQEQLQGERRDFNASQPVHDTPPRDANRGRGACL